jgi:hypothetical protein
MELRKPHFPV